MSSWRTPSPARGPAVAARERSLLPGPSREPPGPPWTPHDVAEPAQGMPSLRVSPSSRWHRSRSSTRLALRRAGLSDSTRESDALGAPPAPAARAVSVFERPRILSGSLSVRSKSGRAGPCCGRKAKDCRAVAGGVGVVREPLEIWHPVGGLQTPRGPFGGATTAGLAGETLRRRGGRARAGTRRRPGLRRASPT